MTRTALLARLVELVAAPTLDRPTRVAVDGPDAAGKTTLADELAGALRATGREVIRASVDGFHRPRRARHARGPDSPHGYYADSFDHGALRAALLDPLGPGGSREYRTEVFDFRADAPLDGPVAQAPEGAVLVVDGVFLLRRELLDAWDVRIHVTVSPDETLRRALVRDLALLGSAEEVERRYRVRYLPGQELYEADARPREAADVVVVNDDPARPVLHVRPPAG